MTALQEVLAFLGFSPTSTPTQSTTPSATIGIVSDVGAVAEAAGSALNAAGSIAKLLGQWDAEMNTPEMIQASEAQKLQAFKDRVNKDFATGDEADLEKLEAQ